MVHFNVPVLFVSASVQMQSDVRLLQSLLLLSNLVKCEVTCLQSNFKPLEAQVDRRCFVQTK